MTKFTFRARFIRSPRDTINIESNTWEYQAGDNNPSVILCASEKDETIKDAMQWVLKCDSLNSSELAEQTASIYIDALALSLAKLRIGADFGSRGPKSAFTTDGLKMLEAQSGNRVLNNLHGLMIYETNPKPLFAKLGGNGINIIRGVQQSHFEKVFKYAVNNRRVISDRDRLSLDLFNASFFQISEDSRFLILVMAIEALLEPSPRSTSATTHVKELIRTTKETQSLSFEEKNSIVGSLNWLRNESINQAGKKLAKERLGDKKYLDKDASSFFSYCYSLRSRLVHGIYPIPPQNEIGFAVAQLEVFVSDLLSGNLRDIELS